MRMVRQKAEDGYSEEKNIKSGERRVNKRDKRLLKKVYLIVNLNIH
jgi:hypothetical protein